MRTGQPLLFGTADEGRAMGLDLDNGRIGPEEIEEQSFLVVPILFGGSVLGVIAGAVALLLPPVKADVAWSRAKGDE